MLRFIFALLMNWQKSWRELFEFVVEKEVSLFPFWFCFGDFSSVWDYYYFN